MKKFLTLTVALLGMSSYAFAAGESDMAEAGAGASIIVPLNITVQRNLSLGVTDRAVGTVTVDPAGDNSAVFYVTGDEGDAVFFNVPANVVLNWQPAPGQSASDAPSSINFATDVKVKHFSKDFGAPDPVTPFSPHPLSTNQQDGSGTQGGIPASPNPAPPTSDGLGQMFVYVGGTASFSGAQQRGSYSGSIPLSVSYQ